MTTPGVPAGGRLPPALRDAAARWIADDPSPADRAELQQVLAGAMAGAPTDIADLTERMSAPLTFGTAGLRGPLRAGPAGMNLAVVRRAAAGIAAYLGERVSGGRVIVGHDARHRSAEFARDAANVLAAAGFEVLLAPAALPTPITAYAVRRLDAIAGLQVTASHNPPRDNGLKVYLAGGSQLVGPSDVQIEAAIAAVRPAVSIDASGHPLPWPDDLVPDYTAAAAAVATGAAHAIRVAATPLHGVGGETLVKAMHLAGFTDVHVVSSQAAPDPDFPTVSFPNPEEPGACDALLALAAEVGADLAIANDPDADRCSIGVPGPDGTWRMLTGDETGALLGDAVLARLDRTQHPDPLVATTIVSSQLLGRIAAARGSRYDETLTGFKWIVRAGDGLGTGLVFGYEEALGLAVDPDVVRDKDGISAAVLACDVVAGLLAAGRTVGDALDDLARAHGLHTTGAISLRVQDVSQIADWMSKLRADLPDQLLGETVTSATDLLPLTDGVRITTDSTRVVIRPSGTEPKLKCYLEIVTPVPSASAVGTDLVDLRARAGERMVALRVEVARLIQQDTPS
ncbi:phosphomannomutase [Nakamurella sp. UYEF19]|uniref:phospho-sugar mutase n=1 Tax=Nakamurella sp. UYEF19 TaxID=1756392 RepID=UPI0033956E2E